MQNLQTLIRNLNNDQWNLVRNTFKKSGRQQSKSCQLLIYLRHHGNADDISACQHLYGCDRSKAFLMTRKRLLDHVLNVLVEHALNANDKGFSAISVLKEIVIYNELTELGCSKLAQKRITKLLKKGDLKRFPELLLYLQKERIKWLSNRQSREVSSQWEEIKQTHAKIKGELEVRELYDNYRLNSALKSGHQSHKKQLQKTLDKIRTLNKETPTFPGSVIDYRLKISLLTLDNEISQCREEINRYHAFLDNLPVSKRDMNMGISFLQLAQLELRNNNYQSALKALDQYRSCSQFSPWNDCLDYLLRSFCFLHQKNIVESLIYTEKLVKKAEFEGFEQLLHIGNYLYCVGLLNIGKTSEAFSKLPNQKEFIFDRKGWFTGYKIIEAVLFIEKKMYDIADSKIESLRKHLMNYPGNPRNKASLGLLHAISRSGYQFSDCLKADKYIHQLEELPKSPLSPEVFDISGWFRSKSGNIQAA